MVEYVKKDNVNFNILLFYFAWINFANALTVYKHFRRR